MKPVVTHSVLKLAWARYGKIRITELEDKIMLFEFANEDAKNQIFDMSPWSIQGHCLSLQKWEPSLGLTVVEIRRM